MMSWNDFIQRLRQKYGDEKYEWLVARHMWHVIVRRLAKGKAGSSIPGWKLEIASRYKVDWLANCWLCEQFQRCLDCPLRTCSLGSVYYKTVFARAAKERVVAARHIKEVICSLK